VPAGWKAQNGVSVHSLELFYVFGDYDYYTRPSWPLAQSLQPKSVTSTNPGLNATDKKVTNEMMEMWSQFAKTGNPSVNGLIKWPEYNSDSDQYLFIADSLMVKTGFSKLGN
jgi:para-nitrobenzyl esterase